jgi:hypothetical protein
MRVDEDREVAGQRPALPPWLRQKEARAAARKLLVEASSLD